MTKIPAALNVKTLTSIVKEAEAIAALQTRIGRLPKGNLRQAIQDEILIWSDNYAHYLWEERKTRTDTGPPSPFREESSEHPGDPNDPSSSVGEIFDADDIPF